MLFSCPAKTFLLGEYLAMQGEACLLVGTEPRFQLQITRGEGRSPFHPDSPAGRLWTRSSANLNGWDLEFKNPWGAGGVGASSAQFLMLHAALRVNRMRASEAWLEMDLSELLRDYVECSTSAAGNSSKTGSREASPSDARPSGADLVVQLRGRTTLFEKNRGRVETRGWGFEKLSFLLFATGRKVATHEHLAGLRSWDAQALQAAVQPGLQAWLDRDADLFVQSVRETRTALRELGFEAPSTTSLLTEIAAMPGVLAAKGCGALGADVIMLVCAESDQERLRAAISPRLRFLAGNQNLSEGLQFVPQAFTTPEVNV